MDSMDNGSDLQQQLSAVQLPAVTMIATSEAMQEVVLKLHKVAVIPFYPVLLTGETGVGKQEAALCLHEASVALHSKERDKKDCPFVDLNCAALAGNLLETELFGHVRGAFTGAVHDKHGLLEMFFRS